jgi:hypothetical protein
MVDMGIDNIGNAGQIVIGAERLAGVFVDQADVETTNTAFGTTITAEVSASTTTVSVFGNSPGGPTSVPRLALDFFVIQGLSLGGSFIYLTRSGDVESTTDDGSQSVTSEDELATQSLFVLAPRIGYAVAFDETFAFWPRVGISYSADVTEDEDEVDDGLGGTIIVTDTTTLKATQLTLEALLVVSPFEGFALAGGPFYDVGLGGSFEREIDAPGAVNIEGDYRATAFGFTVGMLAYF